MNSSRKARTEVVSCVHKAWLVPRTNRTDNKNLQEACEPAESGTESQGTDNKFCVVSKEQMEENWYISVINYYEPNLNNQIVEQ